MSYLLTALIGFLGGVTSGMFGIGGGVIFVPLFVYVRGFSIHTAIGTSLAVIVPTTLMALSRYMRAGNVDWRAAAIVAVFAIAGAWFSSGLSLKLDAVLLRRLLALVLVGISLKLFFQN
ncbi:MAG: sulfite exporter TauE/SafE family protein [Candidatus Omnitrophota bacterium]|nr:sulfite exporter TauE/SafE family protein [Candidatus Omnitrophota bacterium]